MRLLIVLSFSALVVSGCSGTPKKEAPSGQTTPCKGDIPGCFKRAQEVIRESPYNCDAALPLLEEACEAENSEACLTLGKVHQLKVVSNPSLERELKSLEKACEIGSENGCKTAAFALLALDEKEEKKKGVSMLEAQCGKNMADSCVALASLAHDLEGISEKTINSKELIQKAQSLYEADCEKDNARSCRSLGEILAKGLTSKQDLAKAAEYFEKGCGLEDGRACLLLGYCFESGKGVHADIENAKLMYRRSCDLQDGEGCAAVGIFSRDRGEIDEALDFYRKSCELWDGLGCYELAVAHDTGSKVQASKNLAREYYSRSCSFNFPGGCNNLGRMYQLGEGVDQNYEKALELYLKVCDGLIWEDDRTTTELVANACNNAGAVFSQGLGVKPNIKIAIEYFKKGCGRGDPAACQNRKKIEKEINAVSRFDTAKQCYQGSAKSCYDLGIMWGNGEDGPKDLKQAKHWVKIACDNGYKEACELLPSMRDTE
jgi:TPR repeat protein